MVRKLFPSHICAVEARAAALLACRYRPCPTLPPELYAGVGTRPCDLSALAGNRLRWPTRRHVAVDSPSACVLRPIGLLMTG